MAENTSIIIKGARVNNLKNIDVEIPRNKLVVITGLSGSGKSSLAFDTLYAEGQRRYVESLSSYARQPHDVLLPLSEIPAGFHFHTHKGNNDCYGGGEEASDEVPVFQVVEEMPEFPGVPSSYTEGPQTHRH